MTQRPLDRILAKLGSPDLVALLAERLSGSELHTLLLDVAQHRASEKSPAALLRQYMRDRFVGPSAVDPRLLLAFDQLAFSLLTPAFEPLELAPVCPLGTNAAIATCSQDKVVSTMRDTEVVSDPTAVLALEIARRRRASGDRKAILRLCASQRLTRGQAFNHPAFTAHFRLLALASGGRDRGSWHFECESMSEHVRFYLDFFAQPPAIGLAYAQPRVSFTPLAQGMPQELLEQRIIAPLSAAYPEVHFLLDHEREQGRNYYLGLCFKVEAETPEGHRLMLTDGGFTDWTQKLTSDAKERMMTSGIGTELACKLFRCRQET